VTEHAKPKRKRLFTMRMNVEERAKLQDIADTLKTTAAQVIRMWIRDATPRVPR
jgi:hypothetical protein